MPDLMDNERVELHGMLAEFRQALEEEIHKVKSSGLSSTLLFVGRRIESRGSEFWYRFRVEYAPAMPADTPCKLTIGKEQFNVTVVSFDENSIIISSKIELTGALGKARLENGATVLMERLIGCIEENAEKPNPAGDRMLTQGGKVYESRKIFRYDEPSTYPGNTENQNRAVEAALTNDITYIWGPPGTGKTTVIGQIIDGLYRHGRSVLVVSHTNTAVDGAIEKADRTYYGEHGLDEGGIYPILRLGIPSRHLPERVLLKTHTDVLGRELYEREAALKNQLASLQRRQNEIRLLLSKNTWLEKTNLPLFPGDMQMIEALKREIAAAESEAEKLDGEIKKELSEHPEYKSRASLHKKASAQRKELESLCQNTLCAEKMLAEAPQKIQRARDEARKHDVYRQLRQQKEKLMSEQFLNEQLHSCAETIAKLNAELDSLASQAKTASHEMAEYEGKSALGKFFSGKASYLQAKERAEQIALRVPKAEEELRCEEMLEEEYKNQLDEVLLLSEQLKRVIPSQSAEYWLGKAQEFSAAAEKARAVLPQLRQERDDLTVELREINEQLAAIDAATGKLKEKKQLCEQLRNSAQKKREKLNELESAMQEDIARERSLCLAFDYELEAEDAKSVYEDLKALEVTIKAELSGCDIPALEAEKSKLIEQQTETIKELDEVEAKLHELERQAVLSAKIVGTTLAKSYLSDTLRSRTFDTVILDEASMASIPALWCAALLAEKNVVIVGDFLQLPPIVMANTPVAQKWLGQDIFFHSGMLEAIKDRRPQNFIMLNDQFRMESEIAGIANIYYGEYGGLISHDNDEHRIKQRAEFYGWYSGKRTKHSIHLVDTESLHAWVTGVPQGKSHSRLNCFSAAVDVDLAFKCLENVLSGLDPNTAKPVEQASVLIIAPYKPHTARLNKLIDLEYSSRGFKENLNYIRAGTIHSFQGSEADIVIFDLVIDEPHYKAGVFRPEPEVNANLRKMFNVAVTRARFKLYVVGNFAYCRKRAKNNALSELMDMLLDNLKLKKVDAKELLPGLIYANGVCDVVVTGHTGRSMVCREDSFFEHFQGDLVNFKNRLIIYSPFITENRLAELLPYFADAVNAGKHIIVVTKALSERGKRELYSYKLCEKALSDAGVSIVHKKGMHEKLVIVDDDATWIGSLNVLSFSGLTGEVMQRHESRELTADFEKLYDIGHISEAVESRVELACPICGAEMLIKESDSGGIYWSCSSCGYTRHPEQQYPVDGVLRCKCGAPYVFAMKNQPRWVCSQNQSHYQIMRESDLKLEKMAALIPTKKALKEVEKYFAEKKAKSGKK